MGTRVGEGGVFVGSPTCFVDIHALWVRVRIRVRFRVRVRVRVSLLR